MTDDEASSFDTPVQPGITWLHGLMYEVADKRSRKVLREYDVTTMKASDTAGSDAFIRVADTAVTPRTVAADFINTTLEIICDISRLPNDGAADHYLFFVAATLTWYRVTKHGKQWNVEPEEPLPDSAHGFDPNEPKHWRYSLENQ